MNPQLHCLLIDDDIDDGEIFTIAMRDIHESIHTDTALDALSALQRLENPEFNPDLVFIDLNMPRVNGLDCLRRIRSQDRLSELPVIIYSTSANPGDIAVSRREGATDYMVKPTSIKSLETNLKDIVRIYQNKIFV
jgi:DNA-binding response OmpR family regulator